MHCSGNQTLLEVGSNTDIQGSESQPEHHCITFALFPDGARYGQHYLLTTSSAVHEHHPGPSTLIQGGSQNQRTAILNLN